MNSLPSELPGKPNNDNTSPLLDEPEASSVLAYLVPSLPSTLVTGPLFVPASLAAMWPCAKLPSQWDVSGEMTWDFREASREGGASSFPPSLFCYHLGWGDNAWSSSRLPGLGSDLKDELVGSYLWKVLQQEVKRRWEPWWLLIISTIALDCTSPIMFVSAAVLWGLLFRQPYWNLRDTGAAVTSILHMGKLSLLGGRASWFELAGVMAGPVCGPTNYRCLPAER